MSILGFSILFSQTQAQCSQCILDVYCQCTLGYTDRTVSYTNIVCWGPHISVYWPTPWPTLTQCMPSAYCQCINSVYTKNPVYSYTGATLNLLQCMHCVHCSVCPVYTLTVTGIGSGLTHSLILKIFLSSSTFEPTLAINNSPVAHGGRSLPMGWVY